jgi:SOS response regulatory protein OraA/RecX
MLEVIKIMAKGAEDRKTLGIQAKLAQQGVDKEKIKGWIENIEEDNDK